MDLRHHRYTERPLVKTKIIVTAGPACESRDRLREVVRAGADVVRLNFAHAVPEWLDRVVAAIRDVASELDAPVAILGDLAGPKLRLGELPDGELTCAEGDVLEFGREPAAEDRLTLTSNYEHLVDDLRPGDRVLLADGLVRLRVTEKREKQERVVCVVEQPGTIRSRQGINLPGVMLTMPSLTAKDRDDLAWAVENRLDFVGLSFVRSADDIRSLRRAVGQHQAESPPQVVAKIEKMEAVTDLEQILKETDAVMVARGDLGVEVDMPRVPLLQKRIIRLCNQYRIPVITATQMLDSMQSSEVPTRAEASDVANAVLDGSDALMLSGETAIGQYPVAAVSTMSRIAQEAERLMVSNKSGDHLSSARTRATLVTEAVTLGASTAAEHLEADLIVVATHSGRTAMAVSKQRSSVPILALTDRPESARRMSLYWGVTPLLTEAVREPPDALLRFIVQWGAKHEVLEPGSRLVLVGTTDWSQEGKNLMLVHAVP